MLNNDSPDLISEIDAHVARTVAPVHMVFHEIVSPDLHIDIHHVLPGAGRPFHTLVTSGMSERPMNTPPELADYRFAEVAILLDPAWSLEQRDFVDENVYWPLRLLKTTARFPFEMDTFIGYGHSIALSDPPAPFAPATGLAGCFLVPSLSLGESFATMRRADGHTCHFYAIVPLYPEELALKLSQGTDALVDGLDAAGVDDIGRQQRRRVGERKKFLGLF